MKNLFLSILFLLGVPIDSYTQTYYNPSNRVDFTITIREAYKPVDYSKIGRDFNTMIQDELQRRENLKRYYDEIYYQTKSSVYSSTVLTSDNLVNSKILMVQSEVIKYLDIYNTLLKSGSMKPEIFESKVKDIYFTFMNNNQILLQIVQYKYNKDLELGDQTKRNEHSKFYTNTLNSIEKLELNNSGEIEFVLNGLIYPNNSINSLYELVRGSSEGGYESYKKKWEERQKQVIIEKQKELDYENKEKSKKLDLKNYRRRTFDLRKEVILKLDEKGQKKYRRKEMNFIMKGFDEYYDSNKYKRYNINSMKFYLKKENNNFEFERMMRGYNGKSYVGGDPLDRNSSDFYSFKFCFDKINEFIKTYEK